MTRFSPESCDGPEAGEEFAVCGDDVSGEISELAKDGPDMLKLGSPAAVHEATKADTIATETMRHSPVAVRDRAFGNPLPLLTSVPAGSVQPLLIAGLKSRRRKMRRSLFATLSQPLGYLIDCAGLGTK